MLTPTWKYRPTRTRQSGARKPGCGILSLCVMVEPTRGQVLQGKRTRERWGAWHTARLAHGRGTSRGLPAELLADPQLYHCVLSGLSLTSLSLSFCGGQTLRCPHLLVFMFLCDPPPLLVGGALELLLTL